MATLKQLAEKLKSVNNTRKITKAMKLVSTVKLKKAEQLARNSKAYAKSLKDMTTEIASKLNQYSSIDDLVFFEKREIKTIDIIFVTSDKGLCGGFNAKTIKAVNELIEKYNGVKIRLKAIGKKGYSYFSYRGFEVFDNIGSSHPDYKKASEFMAKSISDFKNKRTDKIVLVHNGFKNMILQELSINDMIPVETKNLSTVYDSNPSSALDFEPDDDKEILDSLITKYCEFSIYFSLIDSLAAEHSARMQAMESATKNADEVSNTLTTTYNKTRQALVTSELIEIIGGVEAMK
jgi:F-type H+-transporting ATPase subunit gamma